MLSDEKINSLVARADDIMAQMADNPDPETYVKLSKEFSDLEPVVNNIRELKASQNEFADLAEMLADGDTDAEMKEMAEAEMPELREKIDALTAEIQV